MARRGAFVRAAALSCAVAAACAGASAPRAAAARPVAIVSYYHSKHLPRLVRQMNAVGFPSGTPVYFGSYWGSPRGKGGGKKPGPKLPSPPVIAGPRYSYAPMLPIRPGTFWEGRRLGMRSRRTLRRAGEGAKSGRMPSLGRLLNRMGPKSRRAWGQELGRRFRDRVRTQRRKDLRVVTWQLDEIPSQAAGRGGRRWRDYIRGILLGLAGGRPELGDRHERGIVYLARRAFPLTARNGTAEVRRFWRTVDRTTFRLVGEEYADFKGSPGAAARAQSSAQRTLARARGARRRISRRYVVGMSPGYILGAGLGGNVAHRNRRAVRGWRSAFVERRARRRVAGFAQFNFRGRNSRRLFMGDAVRALVRGIRATQAARRR